MNTFRATLAVLACAAAAGSCASSPPPTPVPPPLNEADGPKMSVRIIQRLPAYFDAEDIAVLQMGRSIAEARNTHGGHTEAESIRRFLRDVAVRPGRDAQVFFTMDGYEDNISADDIRQNIDDLRSMADGAGLPLSRLKLYIVLEPRVSGGSAIAPVGG